MFQAAVWSYYDQNGRHDLPWRQPSADGRFDPYRIMVSEVMLQQTQVARVVPKYHQFLEQFPDVLALATATLGEVLIAWQGLGYNRRAKFLWQAAQQVVQEHGSRFPESQEGLLALPGVGNNTAGAIVSYAYNQPAVFVETNIRTIYIHHFFEDHKEGIADKTILELVQRTLPDANEGKALYRDWYWALMDYGVHLKLTVGNKSRASLSYTRQSPFQGSRRQVRGAVIRELGRRPLAYADLKQAITDSRLAEVLLQLQKEGLVVQDAEGYKLS